MTEFADLRRRLHTAGRRRRSVRIGDAALVNAGAAVAVVLLYYFVDRAAQLFVPARLLLDVVAVVVVGWIGYRFLVPALRSREDEIDVALAIEDRQADDEDLVAALQFDRALHGGATSEYGSVALLEAVVERTAARSRDYRPEVVPLKRPDRRLRYASAVLLAVAAVGIVAYSAHFAALVNRMFLGDAHYPSRTQISALQINGRDVDLESATTPQIVVAAGAPIHFHLTAAGDLPDAATLIVRDAAGDAARVELAADVAASAGGTSSRSFHGVVSPPLGTITAVAHAGDAYTDPLEIVVTAQPIVTVALDVILPDYAAGAAIPPPPAGRLTASILEGSRVRVNVASANKGLRSVVLAAGERRWPLRMDSGAEEGRAWTLDPAGTPLDAVAAPLEFTIDVVDADGFRLPEPLAGSIQLRPDQPPTVAADVVTKFVLPTGKPSITYRADDDLGIRRLEIVRQIVRTGGATTDDRIEIPLPTAASRTSVAGKYALDLASLELAKGDRVTLRVEARDRAGDADRPRSQSEPLTLEVTDEQGLYEAMAETDQRSALKMDEIVKKQETMTGGGVSPLTGPQSTPPLISPPQPTAVPAATPSSSAPAPGSPP